MAVTLISGVGTFQFLMVVCIVSQFMNINKNTELKLNLL